MAAYQFDVIHSASRLVRGRLLVERMEDAGEANRAQWVYVEPAESTSVRAHGTGTWDLSGAHLMLLERTGFLGAAAVWGFLSEFHEGIAKLGASYSLSVQLAGQHLAALTAVENSGRGSLLTLLKEGSVRPRTQTPRPPAIQRTVVDGAASGSAVDAGCEAGYAALGPGARGGRDRRANADTVRKPPSLICIKPQYCRHPRQAPGR